MDFYGFQRFWGQNAWRPVPPCDTLWRPVIPCRTGLDPPNIKISDSAGLDLEAWCLDAQSVLRSGVQVFTCLPSHAVSTVTEH